MVQNRTQSGEEKMNITFNTLKHSLLTALTCASVLIAPTSFAITWQLDDINTSTKYTVESHYFYVGKGSQWQNVKFSGDYSAEYYTTLVIKYDDKLIYNTTLNGKGQVSFPIPDSNTGFHRLDFILQQYAPAIKQDSNRTNFCQEDVDRVTYLTNSKLDYDRYRPIYKIKDLPDALANPQLVRPTPFIGLLQYNSNNPLEAAMLARLATTVNSVTPVEWYERKLPLGVTEAPSFALKIEPVDTPLIGGAQAHIGDNNEQKIPTLTIRYHEAKELEAAINGLTNPDYIRQIDTADASLPLSLASPKWAEFRQFNNLADLGIADFRLGQANKSLFLNFPAVWDPTDILQGQLALRIQSGLLPGSNITTWIDEGLAGSMKLAELGSDPVDHQFNFFAKNVSNLTNYDFRIESSIITNNQCLPSANGSIWIDTKKSTLTLPHRLKNGVAALSMALATHPSIAIDHHDGSLGMAIISMQTAKKMLLGAGPIPLKIVDLEATQKRAVNILVNKKKYDQILAMHPDLIYQPTSSRGYIVNYHNDQYEVIADSTEGAQTFMRTWSKLQPSIPNNITSLFVAENGNFYVLEKLIIGTPKAPLVQQSSLFILIVSIISLMIIVMIVWWFKQRKNAKTKNN